MSPGSEGSMTLAIELSAAKRLDSPVRVISDAISWARYVGLVSAKPTHIVTEFARSERLDVDFFSGPGTLQESLDRVAAEFEADRYVLIREETAITPTALPEWEQLTVTAAANAADWNIHDVKTENDPGRESQIHDDWP